MRNCAGKVLTVEAGAVVQQKGCEAVRLRRSHRSLQPDGVGGHIQGDQQLSGDLVIRLVHLVVILNDMLKTYRSAVVPLLIEKVSVLILLS